MDTTTAQLIVFGLVVLAFGGFATYMDLRNPKASNKPDEPLL